MSSCPGKSAKCVFALDVPGIHVFLCLNTKTWMAGPGHDGKPDRATEYVNLFDPWFGDRILELDERVLVRWRRLVWDGQKSDYTYAQPDALLAATALEHDLSVVTHNSADFARADVPLFNPWAES